MSDRDDVVLERLDALEKLMLTEFCALGERIARLEGRIKEQSGTLQIGARVAAEQKLRLGD